MKTLTCSDTKKRYLYVDYDTKNIFLTNQKDMATVHSWGMVLGRNTISIKGKRIKEYLNFNEMYSDHQDFAMLSKYAKVKYRKKWWFFGEIIEYIERAWYSIESEEPIEIDIELDMYSIVTKD